MAHPANPAQQPLQPLISLSGIAKWLFMGWKPFDIWPFKLSLWTVVKFLLWWLVLLTAFGRVAGVHQIGMTPVFRTAVAYTVGDALPGAQRELGEWPYPWRTDELSSYTNTNCFGVGLVSFQADEAPEVEKMLDYTTFSRTHEVDDNDDEGDHIYFRGWAFHKDRLKEGNRLENKLVLDSGHHRVVCVPLPFHNPFGKDGWLNFWS